MVYKLEQGAWTHYHFEGMGYLTTMAVQQQSRLWLADGEKSQLWYSDNGINWTAKPFSVSDDPDSR
jgi:hypothetical protein